MTLLISELGGGIEGMLYTTHEEYILIKYASIYLTSLQRLIEVEATI